MIISQHLNCEHLGFGFLQLLQLATTIAAIFTTTSLIAQPAAQPSALKWEALAPIPDANGFVSPFAGVTNGSLIVAGGSNFPDKKLWEGGQKKWYDAVYILERPERAWTRIGELPRPIAGGISVSTPDGIACLGGGDAKHCYRDCFLLTYRDGKLVFKPLPELPSSCVNSAGVLVGHTIYVAGGIDRPDSTSALKSFWELDLNNQPAGWRKLEPWSGPGRMLATMGVQGDSLYLFSGVDLKPASDGKPERVWLKDAYRFTPGKGWHRIADLPRVAVAAPNPALALGKSNLLVLGGDDGKQAKLPPETHTGFSRDVLSYDVTTDKWQTFGDMPFSLVTTRVVQWNDRIVIPGGEERPGVRSNKVWSAEFPPQ